MDISLVVLSAVCTFFYVALRAWQQLNVVHSGKVEVTDDRLPFELLRALRDVLRMAPEETRRMIADDMLQLTAEVRPVIEAEGLRVVR